MNSPPLHINYSTNNPDNSLINIGLDAGSTTIKVVVSDSQNKIIYKDYRRHYADISGSYTHLDVYKRQEMRLGE